MLIEPIHKVGSSRTGTLHGLTYTDIKTILGFEANVTELDDPYKVDASWGFAIDGSFCGIWSYRGSGARKTWSTSGNGEKLKALFGPVYEDHAVLA
jgi:hypothetical protein